MSSKIVRNKCQGQYFQVPRAIKRCIQSTKSITEKVFENMKVLVNKNLIHNFFPISW